MEEKVVGVVEAAGEHHVAGPVVEQVAGELHRIERGGAGCVEREGRSFEAERACGELRREARDKAILRKRRRLHPLADASEPGVAGEVGEAAARIGQVADDEAGAAPRIAADPRRVERLPSAMEKPAEGGIERSEPRRFDAESLRVEGCVKSRDIAAARAGRGVDLAVCLGSENADGPCAPGAVGRNGG